MGIIKKHIGAIIFPVVVAILSVACGILPYFAIASARALFKDSPIVVLDEATAYSDPENEAVIHQSIDNLVIKRLLRLHTGFPPLSMRTKSLYWTKAKLPRRAHTDLLQNSPLYQNMWQSHISSMDK